MKTNFMLLVFCCFISTNVLFAQKWYVKADFGYGSGVHNSDFFTSSRTYNITTDTSTYYDTYYNNKTSFGTGIYPSISLGYNISKYITIEMNLGYFKEKSKVIETKDVYNIVYGYSSYANYQCTYTDRAIYLIPGLILSPNLEKINPYFSLGFVLGKNSMKTENDNLLYDAFSGASSPYTRALTEWISSGGLSLGFKSTAGLEVYMSDRLKIFGELSYSSVSHTPGKAKMKKCSLDGVDQLPSLSTSDKEIEFVNEYSDNVTTDKDKPRAELKTTYNLDAILITIGIKYNIK